MAGDGRVVHAGPLRRAAGGVDLPDVFQRVDRAGDILPPGFRSVHLSGGAVLPRMLLAGRIAAVEPAQFLRDTPARAVEYIDSLSAVVVLSRVSAFVVAGGVQRGASFSGGPGHVFSGAAVAGE